MKNKTPTTPLLILVLVVATVSGALNRDVNGIALLLGAAAVVFAVAISQAADRKLEALRALGVSIDDKMGEIERLLERIANVVDERDASVTD